MGMLIQVLAECKKYMYIQHPHVPCFEFSYFTAIFFFTYGFTMYSDTGKIYIIKTFYFLKILQDNGLH